MPETETFLNRIGRLFKRPSPAQRRRQNTLTNLPMPPSRTSPSKPIPLRSGRGAKIPPLSPTFRMDFIPSPSS